LTQHPSLCTFLVLNLSIIKANIPMNTTPHPSIASAAESYLETVQLARSRNTHDTYSFAIKAFLDVLVSHGLATASPVSDLREDAISWFAASLKSLSPATESLYLQAAKGFFKFLAAENMSDVNLPRLDLLRQQRARRAGIRLPQFHADDIRRLLDYVSEPAFVSASSEADHLRALRDRAFLLTLADTGLRVHEACLLRRGQLDWNESRAIIIGKGNKEAVVRFSKRALVALKRYLEARSMLDGSSGKALRALPLFARHDKGAGSKVKPITTATGRNIVAERAAQALGDGAAGTITPHSLRHYFVTAVLRASGNLKLAQELARHASVQVTQRYAHLSNDELDRSYHEIFET
jgi:integrase/recombinase XerC